MSLVKVSQGNFTGHDIEFGFACPLFVELTCEKSRKNQFRTPYLAESEARHVFTYA